MENSNNMNTEQLLKEIESLKAKIADLENSESNYNLLKGILEVIPDGVYIVNEKCDIEYINPVVKREFGAVNGRKCYEYFRNRKEVCPWCKNAEVFAGKSVRWEWHSLKNGKDYELFDTPFKNADGSISKFEIFHDITEKKLADEKLIIALERAEESDRLKSAFLKNMNHEIRTPMNGILGFTDLLKDSDLTDEEQEEYLDIIKSSSGRLLNTINNLMNISMIESCQMKVSNTNMDINKKINELHSYFKSKAEKKGIKFSLNNSLSEHETIIKTDREKVITILKNLINNAVKFTREGKIEFGCSKKRDELEFYVKDSGIGIPADKHQAIFKYFIQAENYTTRSFEGAGLGLSICKAYVEMLGGKIWLESEEGKGTQFYFTIPYIADEKEASLSKDQKTETISDSQKKKLKILIAEDEEAGVLLLSILLKNIDKEILHAKTGTEAIEIYRNNPDIDLVLMDIRMPEMDGYEVTRQIRRFDKKVTIIAQTAFNLAGDREKALASGCNDYISKPLNKEKLLKLIGKYFDIN